MEKGQTYRITKNQRKALNQKNMEAACSLKILGFFNILAYYKSPRPEQRQLVPG